MANIILKIEIETLDGKIYKQPNCRIKITAEGNVMCLVKDENNKWIGVKGKLKINDLVLRKEFHLKKERRTIPMWLIKLLCVFRQK